MVTIINIVINATQSLLLVVYQCNMVTIINCVISATWSLLLTVLSIQHSYYYFCFHQSFKYVPFYHFLPINLHFEAILNPLLAFLWTS